MVLISIVKIKKIDGRTFERVVLNPTELQAPESWINKEDTEIRKVDTSERVFILCNDTDDTISVRQNDKTVGHYLQSEEKKVRELFPNHYIKRYL